MSCSTARYGARNLTYYVWKSCNGFPGNPIQEGTQAPYTLVYDIAFIGYIPYVLAAYKCSDWKVVGSVRMY